MTSDSQNIYTKYILCQISALYINILHIKIALQLVTKSVTKWKRFPLAGRGVFPGGGNGQQSNKDENNDGSLNVDESTFIVGVCIIAVLLVCVIAVVMYFGTKFVQKQNEMMMAGLHSNNSNRP